MDQRLGAAGQFVRLQALAGPVAAVGEPVVVAAEEEVGRVVSGIEREEKMSGPKCVIATLSEGAVQALREVASGKIVRFSNNYAARVEAEVAGLVERTWRTTEAGREWLKRDRVRELLQEEPNVVATVRWWRKRSGEQPSCQADRIAAAKGYIKDGREDEYGHWVSGYETTDAGDELLAAWSEQNVAAAIAQREQEAKVEAALRWVSLHRNGQLGTIFKHREQSGLREAAEAGFVHETSAAASMWVSITDAGRAWLAKRSPEDTVPCGFFGCAMPRSKKASLCASCREEQRKDPEAFK